MTPNTPKRRAPAFQFYADDFLAGTLDLSQAEVGAYVRLLCHQWNRGSIPVEPEKQQRLAGGPVSADVLAKFHEDPDGFLRNPRLEQERMKQADFREQQRLKGIASGQARREQRFNHGSTTVQPNPQPDGQPEVNSPSPSPSPSPTPTPNATDVPNAQPQGGTGEAGKPPSKRFAPPTDAEMDMECARIGLPAVEGQRFRAYYESNGWRVGKNPMKSWRAALVGWKTRWEERNGQHGNTGQRSGGQLTAAQRRNQFIAGADEVQRQAERTAEWERRKLEEDPNWNPFLT